MYKAGGTDGLNCAPYISTSCDILEVKAGPLIHPLKVTIHMPKVDISVL